MSETFYYPATTTINAILFNGTSKISGLAAPSANVQTFTSPGTWVKGAQSNVVIIECWGGGGGGGPTAGGGGGGGAYVRRWLGGVGAPSPQTVTVGAAVAAGTAGNQSSVGTLCVAYGGAAGSTGPATAGGKGGSMDLGGTQGFGAAGTAPGGAGGAATFYGGGGGGGGGGGPLTVGGNGGTSVWGGGGGGGGVLSLAASPGGGALSVFGGTGGYGGAAGLNGGDGSLPGGGGGGGGSGTGGGGAAGYVRVTTF